MNAIDMALAITFSLGLIIGGTLGALIAYAHAERTHKRERDERQQIKEMLRRSMEAAAQMKRMNEEIGRRLK